MILALSIILEWSSKFNQKHTFCKFDLTNVSPDGVLYTDSGGMLRLRAFSGVTLKNKRHKIVYHLLSKKSWTKLMYIIVLIKAFKLEFGTTSRERITSVQ